MSISAKSNLEIIGVNGVSELKSFIKLHFFDEFKNQSEKLNQESNIDFLFSIKEALSVNNIRIDSTELTRYPLRGINNYYRPNCYIDLPSFDEITIGEFLVYLEREKAFGTIELLPFNSEIIYRALRVSKFSNNVKTENTVLENIILKSSRLGLGEVIDLSEKTNLGNLAVFDFIFSSTIKPAVRYNEEVELPMTYKVFEYDLNSIINVWFSKKGIDKDEFIKSIKKCDPIIKYMKITDALKYLEQKNESVYENLDFFGFKINKEIFLSISPLVILINSLILLGLFRSLNNKLLLIQIENLDENVYFPFINGDKINRFIYFFSQVVLPLLAIMLTYIYLDKETNFYSFFIPLLMLVIVVAVANNLIKMSKKLSNAE
jgi:hypothetical protein